MAAEMVSIALRGDTACLARHSRRFGESRPVDHAAPCALAAAVEHLVSQPGVRRIVISQSVRDPGAKGTNKE
ncbi:MAG: hypothetical protein ACPHN3_10920 [Spongiibacter sp.]